MSKILITGGAGYIGRAVVESLYKNNSLYVIDNLSTGSSFFLRKKCKFIKQDLNNFKLLKKLISKEKFDIIIHLAASTSVSESEKNKKKYYINNIKNTINLLKSIKGIKIKSFIFSSSAGVYGKSNLPVNENSPLNPSNYYSYTKKFCEKKIIEYSKKLNFNFIILRYFNVCGSSNKDNIGQLNMLNDSLINNLSIQSNKLNPKVKIYGNNYETKDGTCVRDYIHVLDLANIHKKLINNYKKKKSIILNCGYGKGFSVMQVINKFQKIIKKKVTIKIEKKRKGDIPVSFADVKLLKHKLKWRPRFNNLETIINSSIMWQKKLNKYDKKKI
jgi:UDP-glucose 4-epimerase